MASSWSFHLAVCFYSFPALHFAEDHIISWTNEGDLVFDPMCGSGTTCIAAMDNKRHYIGVDISAEYCELDRGRVNIHNNLFNRNNV